MNTYWRNDAKSMSATTANRLKRGLIQFQKFQRFLRGHRPLRLALKRGVRAHPTARGFNEPSGLQRSTGAVISFST
jgi:hypothetical protein